MNFKKKMTACAFACAAISLLTFSACGDDPSSNAGDSKTVYSYTGGNGIETAVFQYAADSLCQKSDSTISIPFYHILHKDDSKSDDIRVWAYIWSSEYSAKGDTLFMESGNDESGLLHLKKEGGSYVVKSFDKPSFDDFEKEAKELFADYHDEYMEIRFNQLMSTPLRTKIIADFVKQNDLKYTMYQEYSHDAILLFPDEDQKPVDHPTSEIAAIYLAPNVQFVWNGDKMATASTLIYFYEDLTYRQYIEDDGKIKPYTEGQFETNAGTDFEKAKEIEISVKKAYDDDEKLNDVRIDYRINSSSKTTFRLFPIKENKDKNIVAAFMQADKQKLVKTDGSEEMLTTMWFYYDDNTFEQYALVDDENSVLFSSGDYSVTDGFVKASSVLTIHRTKKYQDGKGLADYESEHDYVIGELEFIRVYPEK